MSYNEIYQRLEDCMNHYFQNDQTRDKCKIHSKFSADWILAPSSRNIHARAFGFRTAPDLEGPTMS